MRALQKQYIVDVFVWVDDLVTQPVRPGQKPILKDSELLTILIWDGLTEPHKTLKSLYRWIERDYADCFPKLPKYQKFVRHCHRLLPTLVWFLQLTLANDAPLRFCDSTMLPVCKTVRADRHKVAKGVAQFGKNHQGWWYGFKLHAAVNLKGQLAALCFTPANEYDAQHLEKLVNHATKVVVGDSHYAASPMRKRLWKKYGIVVVANNRKRALMTDWQYFLQTLRQKVEASFGKLKENHCLVSSFPRSVQGYFVHYIRTLIGYQLANG
ncbi:IS982 family transposase [Candidatus Saccharibacteria bacterium]|nr:MAG: IS982 family transposase [Candidatus Saccharibacteria bacterium]